MTMKTILLFLALVLGASAATVPPIPPLPPGYNPVKRMKSVRHVKGAELLTSTALKSSMSFSPASVGPSTNGVLFNPFIFVDPDPQWGKLAVASAHQGPNTVLEVTYSQTVTGPRSPVVTFACYGVDQTFWVSTTGNWPTVFMFGKNIPCVPTFQPAGAERLGPTLDFYERTWDVENGKRVEKRKFLGKGALILGIDLPPNFQVWKKLP